MSHNRVSVLAFLIQLFLGLTVATGFLDNGCHTQQDPWYLENGVAQSTCDTHVCESNVETSLNLNLCIGTSNGSLVAQAQGYFGKTCKDCLITGNFDVLQCNCYASHTRSWQNSSLTLNTGFIYNWYGYLSCFNIFQTVIPHEFYCKNDPNWQPSPTDLDGCTDTSCQGGTQTDAGFCYEGANASSIYT